MSPMRATIDRIEGDVAVLILTDETSHRFTLPISRLPPGTREGDVLTLALQCDEAATCAARDRSAALIARLRRQ